MISKKLFKSFFVYSIVGALPLAWSVILLPFYTNLLFFDDFGKLALYTGITLLIQILVGFGLDSYVTVYVIEYQHDRQKLKECMGTLVSFMLLWSVLVVVFFLLTGDRLFHLLFQGKDIFFYPYGFMSVLTAVFNSVFKTYTNLLIFRQQPGRFFWMNAVNFILTIGFSLAGLYLYPYSLIGPMWGRLLSGVGIFILAIFFLIQEFGFDFKRTFMKSMIHYCYPVFLYSALLWVLSTVDRFIINRFMDIQDVAVYDFAVKCTLLLEFFLYGVANAVSPKIYEIWKKTNRPESSEDVNRYYSVFSALMLFVIPLFVLVIPLIVPWIVKQKDYYQGFQYLGILSAGYATKALFYMYLAPFSFFKKTRLLPRAFFYSAVTQVLIMVFLIKEWGVAGAVWSSLISKLLQVFFLYIEAKKIFRFKFNQTKLVWLPCTFIFLTVFSGQMMKANRFYLQTAEMAVIGFLLILVYRKDLVFLLEQYRKKKVHFF